MSKTYSPIRKTRLPQKIRVVNGLAHHTAFEIEDCINSLIEEENIFGYILENITTVSEDIILLTFTLKKVNN